MDFDVKGLIRHWQSVKVALAIVELLSSTVPLCVTDLLPARIGRTTGP